MAYALWPTPYASPASEMTYIVSSGALNSTHYYYYPTLAWPVT